MKEPKRQTGYEAPEACLIPIFLEGAFAGSLDQLGTDELEKLDGEYPEI